MSRKRLTQIFPFLLPFRRFQRKLFFYGKMRFDGNQYARTLSEEIFPFKIFSAESPLINKNSGYDVKYQYNKAFNLKLASARLNRLIIEPGEVFSFYQAIRGADKKEPYRDGLHLVNGKIVAGYAGGLCQLSSMLYWLFLHTPLSVTERHGHGKEDFPPTAENLPAGVDATVSEGWLDLKIKNQTNTRWQLIMDFDETHMYGEIRCDSPVAEEYEIYNTGICYYEKDGHSYQRAAVNRRIRNLSNGTCSDQVLYVNVCEIGYPVPESRFCSEKGTSSPI